MTKLHVHYSIVTYTKNKIREIRSIAYLNRGYIDPTGSLRTVSESADIRLILYAIIAAFKGQPAAKKL